MSINILIYTLMALEAIVCILLIGIILIQRSKGQGVGLSFGGGAEAVFGAQMGNVLTRATVILGVVFLVNTALLAILRPKSSNLSLAERTAPVASAKAALPVQSAEEAAAALDLLQVETFPVAETIPAPSTETSQAPESDVE